jgi:VCBS repeat-containing protein
MKKILSSVLMFAMAVPLALVPSIATAAGDYAININEPIAISGQTITLTGNASTTNYVGQPSQQHVSVWWTAASLSGAAGNDIVVPTGSFSGGGFNYNWSFNHTYPAGTYTITVKVCHQSCTGAEGSGDSVDTSIVVIPPANAAPIAQAQPSASTNEDIALGLTLVATDSDFPAQTLTYSIVANPTNGVLSLFNSATGAVTYTPNPNYNGSDSFTFKANDGTADSNIATVSIAVNPVNDVPSFTKGSDQTIAEDSGAQSVSGWTTSLSTGPANESGQTLSFVVTNDNTGLFSVQPSISSNGTLTYTSVANASGSATVTVTVQDNGGTANGGVDTSASQTFTITVTPVNDTPVANNDSYGVAEDTTLNVSTPGVLANDSDVENNSLTAVLVTNVSSGTLTLNGDGSFSYVPNSGFNGADSFTYTANDGAVSNTATVTINVSSVNDTPVALADTYSTNEDATLTVTIPGVLTNDSDADLDPLSAVLVTNVSNGSLSLASDGSFVYTPNLNFNGTDSFTYKANDGTVDSSTVTVTITVNSVNDTPVALADTYSTNEDATLTVTIPGVLTNDSDVEFNPLTAVLVSTTTNGTVTLNPNGSFTYVPNPNFFGTDSFTYSADDGSVNSLPVTVTITVNSVNDAPVITLNGSNSIAVTQPGAYTEQGASCSDVEDGNFSASVSGTVDVNTIGAYVVTYTCTDEDEASVSTTRTVTVQEAPAQCSDDSDNDEDGDTDAEDIGCWTNPNDPETYDPNDNNETDPSDVCSNINGIQTVVPQGMTESEGICTTPTPEPVDVCSNLDGVQTSVPANHSELGGVCTPRSNGGGGGIPSLFGQTNGGGSVLGASTGEVLGDSCGLYMDKHIRLGSRKNNAEQVKKLQDFLNRNMGSTLPVTGFYGPLTNGIVKNFQVKYSDEVMKPWGLTSPTGLVYLATLRQINNLECPELTLALPPLVPWSQNPNAQ